MTDEGQKILNVRQRIDAATKSLGRLEGEAEAARERSAEIRQKLVELGYAEVDIDARVRDEIEQVEAALDEIEADIEELKGATAASG